MSSPSPVPRRRGEPVVAKVLETTLREIARVGHENLSIDEVAARAGVNKTTIYRRWPTPEALALSAFERAAPEDGLPDTGSLRGDLLAYLKAFREACRTPAVLSLVRMHFSGDFDSKLGALVKERARQGHCDALVMFTRAIDRDELPRDTDVELVRDLVVGSAQYLVLFQHDQCSDEKLERVVSVILCGAARGAGCG